MISWIWAQSLAWEIYSRQHRATMTRRRFWMAMGRRTDGRTDAADGRVGYLLLGVGGARSARARLRAHRYDCRARGASAPVVPQLHAGRTGVLFPSKCEPGKSCCGISPHREWNAASIRRPACLPAAVQVRKKPLVSRRKWFMRECSLFSTQSRRIAAG